MATVGKTAWVYGLLLLAWVGVTGWQTVEHSRVSRVARKELINRAKTISTTLEVVLRSQRRFGGVVGKERLEAALSGLVEPEGLKGIALLNAAGQVVSSAGWLDDFRAEDFAGASEHWRTHSVSLMNLVDLGSAVSGEAGATNPPVVLSHDEIETFEKLSSAGRTAAVSPSAVSPAGSTVATGLVSTATSTAMPGRVSSPVASSPRPRENGERPHFARPRWLSDENFKKLQLKQGVHSLVIVMSTQSLEALCRQDYLMRVVIVLLGALSVAGLALAWSNLIKSSDLQIRLVRAGELNDHLRGMNLAAAGLAHETRNPLNLIRGMAQMMSKLAGTPPEVRAQAQAIVDEADNVTARLNEFINYSRPREVRASLFSLNAAVKEVIRALSCDIEEKKVSVEVRGDQIQIHADEQQLRQALFNVLMNAVQAVETGGEISVVIARQGATEANLDICDNGGGVPPENRLEIFKPYFTTQKKGTGLGLAVVQQIVLAHGWKLECLANQPKGAIFRFSHLSVG